MQEKTNYIRNTELSIEQNYNMIDGIPNNAASSVPPPEAVKPLDRVVSIDRLDRTTVFQLIDHIAVHEQTDKHGRRTQSIQVKYNFVGYLS